MIETERNKTKTDRAWNILHARLEDEGLLTDATPRYSLRTILPKAAFAAAAVALGILLSVAYLAGTRRSVAPDLLTQQNNEPATTLVTTLEDGSIVYLAGNTSIEYPEHFPAHKREVALQGNALFDITGNRERPFLIETEEVRIEVIGTAFHVKSEENSPFELAVQRGEVKVTNKKNGEDVHVKAGETVTLLSHKLQLSPTLNPEQFAGYVQQIRFKDETLGNILRVINIQTPDIHLQTTPALENRRLTVTFSNNTPEAMAELICLAFNLTYTQNGHVITLSK